MYTGPVTIWSCGRPPAAAQRFPVKYSHLDRSVQSRRASEAHSTTGPTPAMHSLASAARKVLQAPGLQPGRGENGVQKGGVRARPKKILESVFLLKSMKLLKFSISSRKNRFRFRNFWRLGPTPTPPPACGKKESGPWTGPPQRPPGWPGVRQTPTLRRSEFGRLGIDATRGSGNAITLPGSGGFVTTCGRRNFGLIF